MRYKSSLFKMLSFSLYGLITILMAVGSFADRLYGHDVAVASIYASPWMIGLWTIATVSAIVYIWRRRVVVSAALLHLSFVVILAGAALTHFTGSQGSLTIYRGSTECVFVTDGGDRIDMPFALSLRQCRVEYYPGTSTPMDFVSDITVTYQSGNSYDCEVSLNNILTVDGYRLCQSAMAEDHTVFSVSHDPWGIGVTYSGYLLLIVAMAAVLLDKRSGFQRLLRAKAFCVIMLSAIAVSANGSKVPPTLQRGLARDFGRMLVYYNDRVCPVQTLARDFCFKVCGSDSYKGLTAEQVLAGWIFYYNDWKREPMIRIKGDVLKDRLQIDDGRASLADFYRGGRYVLDDVAGVSADADMREANERVAVISSVCTGAALKIYPCKDPEGNVSWLSWVDDRLPQVSLDDWKFIRGSMEFVAREIAHGRNLSADTALLRISEYQQKILGPGYGPDSPRFEAEIIYNAIVSYILPVAIAGVITGLVCFLLFCMSTVRAAGIAGRLRKFFFIAGCLLLVYVSTVIGLRGFIAGQIPLGNGHETMLALAWISLAAGLLFVRKVPVMQPASLIIAGLALIVAMIGQRNPQITHLMPVLQSPLLCIHVVLVMLSYSLLLFMAINSVAAICMGCDGEESERLALLSRVMLYPAVFLLAAGIFVGAVWANQSWGRYWGWDPKETWALITLLIYAVPLHSVSLGSFRKSRVLHYYLLIALLSVIMTYFGVNFLLPGMHSYA